MLTLLGSDNAIHTLKSDDYYIRYLASGLDEVVFNISVDDPDYIYIQEESEVRDRNLNTYLVKQIDAGKDTAKIICQINVNDWKSQLLQSYSNGSATPYNTINGVKPSGWTVIDQSSITTRRTIPESTSAQPYNVTPWEVVTEVCETWGIRARVDTAAKTLTIVNPASYEPLGAFASDELNLKKLQYKGKSTSFATRLYAQGKDGLTFASINDGKSYVDDNTYSNAVVCSWWKDERYTDAQSLLTDARKRLRKLSIPEQSYSCEVYDLAKTNPDMYGIQDFSLFAVINLLDHTKRRAVEHQVVEKWEYPHYPEKNKVTLATVLPSIQNQIVQVQQSVTSPVSTFQQIMNAFVDSQTEKIIGQVGGNLVINDANGDGKPDEILFLDTDDIATATEVWRWNLAGLGHSSTGYNGPYTLAITADGKINADFLMTGTLNAALVNVINLVAQKLISINSDETYKVEIDDGKVTVYRKNGNTWQARTVMGKTGVIGSDASLLLGSEPSAWDDATIAAGNNFVGFAPLQSFVNSAIRFYKAVLLYGANANMVFSNGATLNAKTPSWIASGNGYVLAGDGVDMAPLALKNLKPITSGADLNTYYTAGSYCVTSNSYASGISHIPVNVAGRLIVESQNGEVGGAGTWRYMRQIYTPIHSNGYSYERIGSTGSGTTYTWEAWVKVGGLEELNMSRKPLSSGSATLLNAMLYSKLIIYGKPSSSSSILTCIVVPTALLTTSNKRFQINDEANFVSFDLKTNGNSVTMTFGNASSSGSITNVYGEN